MRKHQKRWVALFGAAAISTAGLGAVPGTASADDKDVRSLSWPVVKQGETSYSIDGYGIGYLPPGLDEYGVNATSSTDRRGNGESQVSWVQGPDQMYGRVTVLRSERFQELDDLRESRYSHLSESALERLEEDEAFEHGAYLSEGTGDLFWVDRPGVAVTTHLQPERWDSDELVRLAESVTEEAEEAESEELAEPVAEAPEEEAQEPEAEAEESTEEPEEEAQEGAEEDDAPEAPAEEEDSTNEEDGTEQGEDDAPEAPADETEEGTEDTVPAEEGTEDAEDVEGTEENDTEDAEGSDEDDPTPAEEGAEDAEDAEDVEEGADQDEAEGTEEPGETDASADADLLPDGVSSRDVKDCLIGQFVDFDTAETDLDALSPETGEFIAQTLAKDELNDAERDRLLATVWYHGNEDEKTAATNDCAQRFDLERSEVEDVIAEVSDIIGALVEEGNQESTTDGVADLSHAIDGLDVPEVEAPDDLAVGPVDAEEWEELLETLPWSVPAEES